MLPNPESSDPALANQPLSTALLLTRHLEQDFHSELETLVGRLVKVKSFFTQQDKIAEFVHFSKELRGGDESQSE